MKRYVTAYWLIPSRPERDLFRTLIGVLARELKAPLFRPHLTVAVTDQKAASATILLRKIAARPVQLSIRDVQFSPVFTRTLIVQFRRSAMLDRLAAQIQRAAGEKVVKVAEPHLSLCYKNLPEAAGDELAALLRLPLRKVTFDWLEAVRCAVPSRNAADVRAWRTLGRRKLPAEV